jgi:hypothetical protein
MSWKSIAGNQTISRANLQNAIDTGVFIQRNGVPGTETNRQITKANAESYIYAWSLYPPLRAKASNQLPVKSNLAVQSNQVYADPYSQILIGNTNRAWVYPIFAAGGDNWGSVASATDNRCILAGKRYESGSGGGGAYVSNDSGETWTYLTSIMTSNDAAMAAAMNSYGDYMIITRQVGSFGSQRAYIYWSYNSGVNWAVGYHDSIDYVFNGAAMSGVGVYAAVLGCDNTSYYVWTSNSFGSTWTKTYLCNGVKQQVQGDCVGMSKSGQYILLTPPRSTSPDVGKCFLSSDYGSTWTYFYLTVPPVIAYDLFLGCSVSAGGDYMTIVGKSSVSSDTRTFISNDFGITFSIISGGNIAQAVDSSGQFQYQSTRASIDYGNTWGVGQSAYAISVNSTTYTTPYIYGITSGGTLYKSVTQGISFSLISISGYFTKVATSGGSNNGKYVAAIRDNNPGGFPNYSLYKSSDYGETWSTNFGSNGEIMDCCAVSDDGIYWLVATYNPANSTSYIYRSINSAATFQYTGVSYFGYPVSCDMSGDGKYSTIVFYYSVSNYSSILRSIDYSASFIQPSSPLLGQLQNKEVTDVCISNNGRYRMLTTREGTTGDLAGRLFYSNDYGATFGEQYYDTDYGMDFCAMDNSGKVCMAGGYGLGTIKVYYSINGTFTTTWQPPIPLYPPVGLGGLNISNDGTYWTIAANFGVGGLNPFCYTYTSTDAGSTWTQSSLYPTVNDFKGLSK